MKIVCLIPVRLNSKRIKNKNFIKIKNLTLLELVCKKIVKSKYISNFYIASEKSNKVQNLVEKNKKINYFARSKKSSTHIAKTEIVIKEFIKKIDCDLVVLVQVTNPFVSYKYLDEAIIKLKRKNYDTLLSVVKSKDFLWQFSSPTTPLNYNYRNRKMSQKLKGHLIENGSFYIFYKSKFLKHNNRLHGKIGYYEMPKKTMHEIDDYQDLKIIKKLI
mgnify:FL=1|jgi:N-acylneuraminate cytidylyltransferase|tara:strand:+ start:1234 stop:1884 length:651 start_codon:yes stop_codon:yes gene_type:complete